MAGKLLFNHFARGDYNCEIGPLRFFSIFGVSLWIFPRLFDNVDMIDSFKPFINISWWEGSNIYSTVTRVAILSIFCYYGYHIYMDPTIIKGTYLFT
jgi:hypothetical protein